jgi:hypothetical protein
MCLIYMDMYFSYRAENVLKCTMDMYFSYRADNVLKCTMCLIYMDVYFSYNLIVVPKCPEEVNVHLFNCTIVDIWLKSHERSSSIPIFKTVQRSEVITKPLQFSVWSAEP